MAGILYLCATPIGNLEDMTFRAVRVLGEVDLIAAEDTRNSIKLLNHFEIKTPMTSYHEYNKIEKGKKLVQKLLEGQNIALITDAGLPSDKKERQEVVKELEQETRTIILYEAPHRLVKTLKELEGVLGNRRITVCRELTKKHETAFVTTLREAIVYYEETDPKGECVLVVEGKSREEIRKEAQSQWEQMSLEDHVQYYMDQGIDKKEAMKKVAKDRGISKRDVYNSLI